MVIIVHNLIKPHGYIMEEVSSKVNSPDYYGLYNVFQIGILPAVACSLVWLMASYSMLV